MSYEHGGYYHVCHPRDPDEMQRMLNGWYAKVGQFISESARIATEPSSIDR